MTQVITEAMLKKALVIDDSVQSHQAYNIMLSRYKCVTIAAKNAERGLQQLTDNPDVDLLIINMNMPRQGGSEFIARIKALGTHDRVPLIVVSSDNCQLKPENETAPAEGCLKKPFTSTEFHSIIRKLFPQTIANTKNCHECHGESDGQNL
jgi:CheY-like chemotaxis protein